MFIYIVYLCCLVLLPCPLCVSNMDFNILCIPISLLHVLVFMQYGFTLNVNNYEFRRSDSNIFFVFVFFVFLLVMIDSGTINRRVLMGMGWTWRIQKSVDKDNFL